MIRTLIFAVTASVTLGLAPAIFAQQSPIAAPEGGGQGRGAALRNACAAAMRNFCSDAQDRQSRRQCLIQNKDKVSSDCAAALLAPHDTQQK